MARGGCCPGAPAGMLGPSFSSGARYYMNMDLVLLKR